MLYRIQQFWLALNSRPKEGDLLQASLILGPRLYALFQQMDASEQAHSLQVLRRVQAQKFTDHNLLVAALLHDCGKSRRPLHLWERIWIVMAKTIIPAQAKTWGSQPAVALKETPFWRQPLIVAAQHAHWGAEMAELAGATQLSAALIRRHQDHFPVQSFSKSNNLEDSLLAALQAADNQS